MWRGLRGWRAGRRGWEAWRRGGEVRRSFASGHGGGGIREEGGTGSEGAGGVGEDGEVRGNKKERVGSVGSKSSHIERQKFEEGGRQRERIIIKRTDPPHGLRGSAATAGPDAQRQGWEELEGEEELDYIPSS
eukprot:182315-Hanusia_phi.AAC.1